MYIVVFLNTQKKQIHLETASKFHNYKETNWIKYELLIFQLLTLSKLYLFFFKTLDKSKNCTHKMQNASHILQNEALHSKYRKHI